MAPRASDEAVFHASIEASGTANARRMPRVQPRLAAQRLGDLELLDREGRRVAALEEAVGVGRIVFGRRHEQPAGVLDAVRHQPAQQRVLVDALLGRHRILDDVAPAGVQQAVEAPARALDQVARSTSTTSKPRRAASQAVPTPVAPPPMTKTSVWILLVAADMAPPYNSRAVDYDRAGCRLTSSPRWTREPPPRGV